MSSLWGGCIAHPRSPEAYPGRHYHPRHFRKRSRCPGGQAHLVSWGAGLQIARLASRTEAAARSKCVPASLISADERGPATQAAHRPLSTYARIRLAAASAGAAFTTFADKALSPSSFHQSGLAASSHSVCRSRSKAFAVAATHSSEPSG
eukprot:scaffold34122_cov69-Phaeocystis_antarctica.AAC.1